MILLNGAGHAVLVFTRAAILGFYQIIKIGYVKRPAMRVVGVERTLQ